MTTFPRADCFKAGGDLGSLHSEAQNTFVATGLIGPFGKKTWLGAERLGEDEWTWDDGTPFNYTHWAIGQ